MWAQWVLLCASVVAPLSSASAQDGTLVVVTDPLGATVTIDGAEAGESPLRVGIAAGTHTILVQRDGYAPAERSVSVPERGVGQVFVRMQRHVVRATQLRLRFAEPRPPDLQVRVDGRVLQPFEWVASERLARITLRPGDHVVELVSGARVSMHSIRAPSEGGVIERDVSWRMASELPPRVDPPVAHAEDAGSSARDSESSGPGVVEGATRPQVACPPGTRRAVDRCVATRDRRPPQQSAGHAAATRREQTPADQRGVDEGSRFAVSVFGGPTYLALGARAGFSLPVDGVESWHLALAGEAVLEWFVFTTSLGAQYATSAQGKETYWLQAAIDVGIRPIVIAAGDVLLDARLGARATGAFRLTTEPAVLGDVGFFLGIALRVDRCDVVLTYGHGVLRDVFEDHVVSVTFGVTP